MCHDEYDKKKKKEKLGLTLLPLTTAQFLPYWH